uniref:DUF4220 domain-containing protein n=1 Tax=Oryza brachyantha TaxID=4533 RepID=J3L8J4_ORYBR|nr:hypothetical protein [Oryza brachyantha]
MAGDGKWVMDIVLHTAMLAGNAVVDLWSGWSTEIMLGVSFAAQLVLTVTAGFRWRSASPGLRNVIWFFYVGADYVATTALGHLSLSGTSGRRRLVAFWAPFFLLHLGGADSISAYELEDNQLSARSVLELVLRVLGALYIVYKSINGSWVLGPASGLMLFVGVAKYTEKTLALSRANLANIRAAVERQRRRRPRGDGGGSERRLPKFAAAADDDEGNLVMKAHALFHICKNSMVDSSVDQSASNTYDATADHTKETLFQLEWKQLFMVMEMELSLMYDFLYTKAGVIYTWHGYAIRAVSPVFTAVSLVLVELSNVGGRHKRSDVVITRILLVSTFLLETASLLRAVASTWTGFFLHRHLRQGWIRHEALCASRWLRFRRMFASIGRLANTQDHRRWCGKMGQLSVLQLVTGGDRQQDHRSWDKECKRYSEKKTMVIPQDVKELVFRRVRGQLVDLRARMNREVAETGADMDLRKMAANLRTKRGQLALQNFNLLSELRWSLGDELQLGILTWHVATEIYLVLSGRARAATRAGAGGEEEDAVLARPVRAIRTLSDYMMYLLAVRPDMLPGLVTSKLFELTCEDVARIWSKHQTPSAADVESPSPSSSPGPSASAAAAVPRRKFFPLRNRWRVSPRLGHTRWEEEELARRLIDQWRGRDDASGGGIALNKYLARGVELAMKLLDLEAKGKADMLQVTLEVWVDMLFYASYRCSKESHAKQLSQGGELTTVLWLVAEHVGLFLVRKSGKGVEEDNWRRRKDAKQARKMMMS